VPFIPTLAALFSMTLLTKDTWSYSAGLLPNNTLNPTKGILLLISDFITPICIDFHSHFGY